MKNFIFKFKKEIILKEILFGDRIKKTLKSNSIEIKIFIRNFAFCN